MAVTINQVGQPPVKPVLTSNDEMLRIATEEADQLYGPRQIMPAYNPDESGDNAQVHSYSDMVRKMAAAYAPTGETDKEKKARKWSTAISVIGDVLAHGINAYGAAKGANAMVMDPSQSLSAQAKARYDKVIATQQANRDKYLSLLLKAADIDTKYGGTAKSNYNKAYDAQVKGVNAANSARDNYIKNRVAGMQNDIRNAMSMYGHDVSLYNNEENRRAADERFYAPQTTTTSTNRQAIQTNPITGESQIVNLNGSNTTTTQRRKTI